MRRKIISFFVVLIILVGGWVVFKNSGVQNKTTVAPSPSSVALNTDGWQKTKASDGLNIDLPSDWVMEEVNDTSEKRLIAKSVSDSTTSANFKQLVVTILQQPETVGALQSQEEFDEWYKSEGENASKSGTLKVKNTMVDQYPAIIIRDLTRLSQQLNRTWSEVAWFRKNDTNYYINYEGNGQWNNQLEQEYDHMLSSIKFDQ